MFCTYKQMIFLRRIRLALNPTLRSIRVPPQVFVYHCTEHNCLYKLANSRPLFWIFCNINPTTTVLPLLLLLNYYYNSCCSILTRHSIHRSIDWSTSNFLFSRHLARWAVWPFWRNSTTLAKFKIVFGNFSGLIYLVFGKVCNTVMAKTAIGQFFIVLNGQILKNNIAIWSHWTSVNLFLIST